MPRIRSIKPEHWNDKNLPKISIGAHLLWIGMWNFSDDKGIIEKDYHLIKADVFPRRKEVKPIHIEKWVKELIKFEFVIPLQHKGIQYLIHRTFDVHQKIDRPQKSKIGDDVIRRTLDEHSTNSNRTFDDDSENIRRKERIGEDRRGEDRIRRGEEGAASTEVYLVPEMLKIWKIHKPSYPADQTKDFTPLQSIAVFICEQAGMDYNVRSKDDDKNLYELWDIISKFVSEHNFFKNYSLHQVEKHIQSITQEIRNGQSGSKNGKSGAGKVNGQQVNTAFTKFYQNQEST